MATLALIGCFVGFVLAFAGTLLSLIGMQSARPMAVVGAALLAVGAGGYFVAKREAPDEMLVSLPACERGTIARIVPPTHVITVEDVRIARSTCDIVAERLARRAVQDRAMARAVNEGDAR